VSGLLCGFGKNQGILSDLSGIEESCDLIDFEFLPTRLGSGGETVLKCVVFVENSAGQSGGAKPGSTCRSSASISAVVDPPSNSGFMARP
jgi:hypothetical protein